MPALAVGRIAPRPSGIQSPDSDLRCSRFVSGLGGTPSRGVRKTEASHHAETQPPGSPAAARAPPAATRPRRQAWLRISVVRYGLPCDPPVGGHSCNGRSYHASVAGSVAKADRQVEWMLPNDRW